MIVPMPVSQWNNSNDNNIVYHCYNMMNMNWWFNTRNSFDEFIEKIGLISGTIQNEIVWRINQVKCFTILADGTYLVSNKHTSL